MTIRKACSLFVLAAFVLASAPVGAQQFAPNTVWGQVPQGLSGNVGSAVLLDANGNVVATAQLVNGQFEFPNVAPGDYTVEIKDTNGNVLAASEKATLPGGGVMKALFTGNKVIGGAAPQGGGVPTALIVAGGAVAVGVGTAVVLTKDKNKDKPPNSPKK